MKKHIVYLSIILVLCGVAVYNYVGQFSYKNMYHAAIGNLESYRRTIGKKVDNNYICYRKDYVGKTK